MAAPKRCNELADFPQFDKFPAEIRLQIWNDALPGPRVVHLKQETIVTSNFGLLRVRSDEAVPQPPLPGPYDIEDSFPYASFGFRSSCPAPNILYVCRESCQVVKKLYTRMFTTLGALPTIWFRPSLDILFIDDRTFDERLQDFLAVDSITPDDLDKVENLCVHYNAVHEETPTLTSGVEENLDDLLDYFPNATDVTIVADPITHMTAEKHLTAGEQTAVALLPIEDYLLALARREAEIETVGGWVFVGGFETLRGIECPGFQVGAFQSLREMRGLSEIRVDVKAFMKGTLKQHLLRGMHLQRPTTKKEARYMAKLMRELNFEDIPYDLLRGPDEEDKQSVTEDELDDDMLRYQQQLDQKMESYLGFEDFENEELEDESGDEFFGADWLGEEGYEEGFGGKVGGR